MADDENNQGLGAGATTTRRVTFDTTTAAGAPADVASSAAPTSPMTSPEPAEEPGAGGGASATPTPTDANLPETQEEWHAEEAPSSLSKETDPPVDPFDEVSSPEFVMHDGQVLDPNVETKVWVIKTNSDKELLATYVGWRVRILDPFDVPQARRYDLTERRQVVAMFPQNESRVVRDCWPTNINRIMEKPWHGDITFYESHEKGDPFRPFGTWTATWISATTTWTTAWVWVDLIVFKTFWRKWQLWWGRWTLNTPIRWTCSFGAAKQCSAADDD